MHYVTSIRFYFDFLGTYPPLFLLYFGENRLSFKWVYFFKIVRIYELKALSATISRLVGKCKEYKNAKK